MNWPVKYLFSLLILQACHAKWEVNNSSSVHYDLKETRNDSLTTTHISPYKNQLEADMNTVVAYADSALTREGFEPKVGNFVLQAMDYYIAEHQPGLKGNCVLLVNRGGLRCDIPKGNITKGNIFELMPFDNEIVILTIKGEKLKDCINAIAAYKKILTFNVTAALKDSKAEAVFILDQPLDISKEYVVITSDYLADGGDNATFFAKPVKYERTNMKIRDALFAYCGSLSAASKHLTPFTNGKVRISK